MTGFPWPAAHFDPRGRLSRRAYHRQLIGTLLLVVVSGSIAILVASMEARSAALIVVAAGTIGAGAFVTVATVRRLHDRGRTGWWLLPNAFVTVAGFAPIETLADAYPVAVIVATLAMTGFNLWFLIETVGLAGMAGSNRYGLEPEH